jgi:hypothetical protein
MDFEKQLIRLLEETAALEGESVPRSYYLARESAKNSLHTAQHRVQLTALRVGGLAFVAGFGICWFVFVR